MGIPDEILAARVALLMLNAAAAPGRVLPTRILWTADSIELETAEVEARLVQMPKPVLCTAASERGVLAVSCTSLRPPTDAIYQTVPDVMLSDVGPWLTTFSAAGQTMLLSRDVLRCLMAGYVFRGLSWGLKRRDKVGADNVGADLTLGP